MTLAPPSELRDVSGLSEREKEQICAFIQGAVYCWCKNRQAEWFSMRDLMGGENGNWEGTPFDALYQKHRRSGLGEADAVDRAGKDSGWLLKSTLSRDQRQFEHKEEERIRKYRWKASAGV